MYGKLKEDTNTNIIIRNSAFINACLYFVGGTEIGKGGPLLAAKISPGGPVLAGGPKFSLHTRDCPAVEKSAV